MNPLPDEQPTGEQPVSPSQRRFSATEPLDELQTTLPATLSENPSLDVRSIPKTSAERCQVASIAASVDQDIHLAERITAQEDTGNGLPPSYAEETVLYLAYGSNLASKTFLGMRGIKPISKISVLVPELRLTFDLPGLPYAEPCFAGTEFRDPETLPDQESESEVEVEDKLLTESEYLSEKASLLVETKEVHEDTVSRPRWDKPLVGVVYEVTLVDYAKIIATEGGGRGYKDVVVDCFPFAEDYIPTNPVPSHPSTQSFKAHSLLSPSADEARKKIHAAKTGECSVACRGQIFREVGTHLRPDPEYAQPSARYLGLLMTGAEEHDLPCSYRDYLSRIHPYSVTRTRQKIGKIAFLAVWAPPVLIMLGFSRKFAGPDGRSPPWLISMSNAVWAGMWHSYDYFFKGIFGDGERTIGYTLAK
ncbi:uncharacterized protein N7483_009748 [Penicillium malachiteum]|uniref:uncharacterized protein n=1 Tax=Penicillium malachiteum TaxID=1324776 RepID=UPI002549A2AB|nr:uncharacterized protein N7483_009748 [Penicillium malachiteum]KAJ5721814.1 hypothetical protein N7483_009748 [Penicillium malachiteum]